ncbi:hypothetical protein [Flavobacterium sp. ACAM 123]|uniref:hypothetical protein n=1 Tax=Flavobacterium sp. ACAM 123 TaxID=1189620 RepID=UPI0002FC3C7F|nr:hypothetical protein [Flavobacterium sp. ACAM 123]
MKDSIFKGRLVVAVMSLMIAYNQKKEVSAVTVYKEAIKTEIQALEHAYAQA